MLPPMDTPLWRQFRRLLLGAVVEALLPNGVDLDLRTLELQFVEGSVFHVPHLNNYMRFVGIARGRLRAPLSEDTRARLLAELRRVWPDIVSALHIPIGDALTVDKEHVEVIVTDEMLEIRFDLSAD